jgi:membrane protein implicated in regulation of membrane protease activity
MTPPQSTISGSKTLAAYAIGYVIAIASIVSDIRLGGVHFTLIGFATSLVLSALVIYRMARAMALAPTPARREPATVGMPSGQRLVAA